MGFDRSVHHRRSIRLPEYDYSQSGAYFVTICAQDRLCLWGDIVDGHMQLNAAGRMVDFWYRELAKKFSDTQCDDFVCMPNHVHCIIFLGVGRRSCLDADHETGICDADAASEEGRVAKGEHVGSPLRWTNPLVTAVGADRRVCPAPRPAPAPNIHHPPLSKIVQWLKTMTTNAYIHGVKQLGWPGFDRRLWQRNYYEHVIRDEADLRRIRQYIQDNPLLWEEDALHPKYLGL